MELVQILVGRGARLDNILLSTVDNYDMVDFLLSRGAKIVSRCKLSAITDAAGAGNIKVVELLLSHANEVDMDASRDALHWAAASGRMDTAKLLIERGFDVNATTKDCLVGETPLFAMCEIKKLDPPRMAVAKFLVEKGANIHARNRDGRTVAELLVQNDRDGLIREDPELQQLIARIEMDRDEKNE